MNTNYENLMNNTLSLTWMSHVKACNDGIKFAKRNKLVNFPFKRLDEIEGDYNCFITWVKLHQYDLLTVNSLGLLCRKQDKNNGRDYSYQYDNNNNITLQECTLTGVQRKYKYDHNNNVTHYWYGYNNITYIDESYYYDENNNMIRKVNTRSAIKTFQTYMEYDDNNNLIHQYDNNGIVSDQVWFEYDNSNNMIYKKTKLYYDSSPSENWYQYDSNNNISAIKNGWGVIVNHDIEYYPDGQLKKYDELEIPFFEK